MRNPSVLDTGTPCARYTTAMMIFDPLATPQCDILSLWVFGTFGEIIPGQSDGHVGVYYRHCFGSADTKLILVLPESTASDFVAAEFFA
ncbi:hypothetical protein BKM12_12300 [Pseudomonas syringae pv. syringae]|jgi:hypothetical protein|nr:hypothetical protein BKM12_12300 [Pseudomonas syringae pv. syringae]